MRVLIFSAQYGISGSSIRAELIARGLRKIGVDVAVSGYGISENLRREVDFYVFKEDGPGSEFLYDAALDFKPDWILGITEDAAAWVVQAAQKIGSQIAFDLHAISPFEIIELGKGYGSRLPRLKNALANLHQLKYAQLIITAAPGLTRLARLFWRSTQVLPLTGMLDTILFPDTEEPIQRKDGHQPYQVYYIGNFYKWQGIQLYLDAARRVLASSDQCAFKILGSVGKAQAAHVLADPLIQDGKIEVLDAVKHEQVPAYLKAADILVIPRPRMLSTEFAFPSKLAEYMASGRLTVATDLSPHRWALTNPVCGELCAATSGGLASAILNYDAVRAANLGRVAHSEAINRFDYIKQCRKMKAAFENHQ